MLIQFYYNYITVLLNTLLNEVELLQIKDIYKQKAFF